MGYEFSGRTSRLVRCKDHLCLMSAGNIPLENEHAHDQHSILSKTFGINMSMMTTL